jgi:hypothetical protein
MALLQFDQFGIPPGVPGVARNDGVAGGDGSLDVTLTDMTSGGVTLFELLWVDPADTTSLTSLHATGDPHVWKFSPTPGVTGPIRVRLTHTTSLGVVTTQTRIFGIPDENGIVKPAPGELSDPNASMASAGDSAVIDRCERNWPTSAFPGGNPFGWGADLLALIAAATIGGGDVSGPSSAADNAVARFDASGTSGKLLQTSLVTISDAGSISLPSLQTVDGRDLSVDGVLLDAYGILIPTTAQKAALAGTSGSPGSGNKFVTDADARNTNARTPSSHAASHQLSGSDVISVAGLSGRLAAAQLIAVKKSATLIGTRGSLNLNPGTNVTLTVADNAGTDSVDVTINASSGGSAVASVVLATPPAVANLLDDEFASATLDPNFQWWDVAGAAIRTPALNIDPFTVWSSPTSVPRYALHTAGNGARASWLKFQVPDSAGDYYITKPGTLPVGSWLYIRYMGPAFTPISNTTGGGKIGVVLCGTTGGHADPANSCVMSVRTDGVGAFGYQCVAKDTTGNNGANISTSTYGSVHPFLGIYRRTTTAFNFFAWGDDGTVVMMEINGQQMNCVGTLDRIGIVCNNIGQGAPTVPNGVLGLDCIRVSSVLPF